MSYKSDLISKFESKSAYVGVVGMGYVGVPMAHLAASQGFKVEGFDVDEKRVNELNSGFSPTTDVKHEELQGLIDKGLFHASLDFSAIAKCDVIIIAVPTPLNKTGDPDISYILSAVEKMTPFLHKGMMIALESTTYPGTTEDIFIPLMEKVNLEIGSEIFVAFSPERVDPGNEVYTTKNTPKIVGGITPDCMNVAEAYYKEVVDKPVPVSSTVAAEMVKLYENTFRAINIGLANELAIICNLLDIDVWEIVNSAATKPFGFMPFYPGPGLGGHCIPIDPSYLSWRMRNLNYKTRFIDLATEVNTKMPEYIISRIATILNDYKKAINGSKFLVVGVAYKSNIDDLRESPALDIIHLLKQMNGDVSYHDPYCPVIKYDDGDMHSNDISPEMLKEYDLVIITTGHDNIDWEMILNSSKHVFDTRNITRNRGLEINTEVSYL